MVLNLNKLVIMAIYDILSELCDVGEQCDIYKTMGNPVEKE